MFDNEFFQGGLGLALLGGIIAVIGYAPKLLWHVFQRRFMSRVYVRDEQQPESY